MTDKDVLIALLKDKKDFAILQTEGWYRIPIKYVPRRWPPRWLAFYQPKAFGKEAYRIRYFGEVGEIQIVPRSELFPNEFSNSNSDRFYYKIHLKSLEERASPIPSLRPRRLVFIPTTWRKFNLAEQINDLFDDSPIEDHLWDEFKRLQINAERQWGVQNKQRYYQLDFALFCSQGTIDIEADGDTWHARRERIPLDNQRDNDMQSTGWHVLRFNGKQILEQAESYCLGKIQETINSLGGLTDEGMVPRIFYPQDNAQQMSLFEEPGEYQINEDEPFEWD
jgi:very-short-patch-repair endonuclease